MKQRYLILSSFTDTTPLDADAFLEISDAVKEEIQQSCPSVTWIDSYGLMGPFDVMDVIETESPREARLASAIIRKKSRAVTQVSPAIPWKEFKHSGSLK